MAPKRKTAPSQSKPKSPGQAGRTVEDLFSAIPPSKFKRTAKSLIGPRLPSVHRSASWPDLYAPKSRGELAVHKKKLENLAEWLKAATPARASLQTAAMCCCISGPPGSGRSTSIKLLAQERQCNVHQWAFPTPTLWSEHRHIGADSLYTSKMDEFQAMVGDMKYTALTWTSAQALEKCMLDDSARRSHHTSQQPFLPKWAAPRDGTSLTISVISDFPHLHSVEARSQFCDQLMVLVQSARRPTILLVTDSGKARCSADVVPSGTQHRTQSIEQLIVETATNCGAVHIAFNPITARACMRELKRVAKAERLTTSDMELEMLVEESHCDLRNALQALQLRAIGQNRLRGVKSQPPSKVSDKHENRQARDLGLSLFHALGKILYNKKEHAVAQRDALETGAQGPPVLTAEEVITRSGLGASVITSFLFESYLEFVAEGSIVDAAFAADNFSSAMQVLGQASTGANTFGKQWVDPEHLTASPADAAASALACRGYMWANQHPTARKWQPIRAPKMALVARAAANNRAELAERSASRKEIEPAVMVAIQVIPYARLMVTAIHSHPARVWLPVTWHRWWAGAVIQEPGGGIDISLSRDLHGQGSCDYSNNDPIEG
eukprot:jgi/Ulvmu1/7224/UM035_0010.1